MRTRNDDDARPSRLPLGLLGTVVLVAACERSVARHSLDLTAQANWEWRLSARAARDRSRPGAVLGFGSSLMKLGVAPGVIEEAVGRPMTNLGLCAGPAPASYFLLRRALEAGARPSAILVEFHPMVLTRGPWHAAEFWPDLLDTREAVEYAYEAGDAPYLARICLARAFPSLKDRHGVRQAVRSALAGEGSPTRLGVVAMRRNVKVNHGAMLVPKRPVDPATDVIPPEESAVSPGSWACSTLNRRYVERFLDLAARHGVPVVWVLTPAHPSLQALRERNGLDAGYRAFVREVLAGRPDVVVADATRAGYSADLFIDSQHLDRDGAACLSAGLAPTVKRVIGRSDAGGRWVSLGPPRAPAGGVAIEDYGMSVRAVLGVAQEMTGTRANAEVVR